MEENQKEQAKKIKGRKSKGKKQDGAEDESQKCLVPRKDKKKELNVLLHKSESHVIYVAGESGIGKRYLVKKAYENEKK